MVEIGSIIHFLENTFLTNICTFLLEMVGIVVLMTTAVKCFVKWLRREQHIQLNLAHGIALALTFKMGGEVLRTVVVREWRELGILGAIIVLRAALTVMLHWEIKSEEEDLHKKELRELKKY